MFPIAWNCGCGSLRPHTGDVTTTLPAAYWNTDQAELLYEVRDGIGRITFNRPQARNALTFPMYERLAEICGAVADDSAVKALLITGAGIGIGWPHLAVRAMDSGDE